MDNNIIKTPELRRLEAMEKAVDNWEVFVQTFRSFVAILVLWTLGSFFGWIINLI
tara:strand:+ start:1172 stop:1336 length:165 start_codon:yes stop_codon:yes gene_type:complete